MNPNDLKELSELIDFLKENKIAEFDLERGDIKIRLKFEGAASAPDMAQLGRLLAAQGGGAHVHAAPAAAAPEAEESGLKPVKSPIVGTFYEAASPARRRS